MPTQQVRALFLAGAYAGWAGSLSADTVEQRLRTSLEASQLAPAEFVSLLLPSMFSASAPQTWLLFRHPDSRASPVTDVRDWL